MVIPDGTKRIGDNWFYVSEVKSVAIPASVEEIGVNAFCACEYLKHVGIEENGWLRTIGDYAFCRCRNLARVHLPKKLEKIGVGCFSYSGLEEAILPESAREVGAEAFFKCKHLKTAQLNDGLQTLGTREVVNGRECEGEVFLGSALESIRLPSTLKRIESMTFSCCENLRSIDILSGVECIGEKCFTDSRI